jgi:hypothetical protein
VAGKKGRRRKQLLDDLDCTVCRTGFGRGYGSCCKRGCAVNGTSHLFHTPPHSSFVI